jgi:hypothetical protein
MSRTLDAASKMRAHSEQMAAETFRASRLGWCGKAGSSSEGKIANGIALQYSHRLRTSTHLAHSHSKNGGGTMLSALSCPKGRTNHTTFILNVGITAAVARQLPSGLEHRRLRQSRILSGLESQRLWRSRLLSFPEHDDQWITVLDCRSV